MKHAASSLKQTPSFNLDFTIDFRITAWKQRPRRLKKRETGVARVRAQRAPDRGEGVARTKRDHWDSNDCFVTWPDTRPLFVYYVYCM